MKINQPDHIIYICAGSKCDKKGGKECFKKGKKLIKSLKASNVEIIRTECTGRCKLAPVACVQPENRWMLTYKQDEILAKILHLAEKKS